VLCLADPQASDRLLGIVRRRHLLPPTVAAAGQLIANLADRQVRTLVLLVAALVAVSAAIFHWVWHLTLLDAVYFTVTTITTIGYGDITLVNAPWYLKTYGIVLELLGAVVMAIFFAVITDTLVGARLRQALGGLHRDVDDHIVVCGLGNMGHRIVELIHEHRVPVVAMELNEQAKALAAIRRLGIPVLIGDAREVVNLQSLRLETARSLVVATEDDMTNLEIALTARGINPELKVVIQLHDPDLAARLQRALGLGTSRSLSGLSAPAFVSAALGHRVISAVPVGERMLVIAVAGVVPSAESVGQSVGWLQAGPYCRVLMIQRGDQQIWTPPLDTSLEAGDELVIVATRKGLDGVLRLTEVAA
jgi:Trk K+ transport system NAD-binding subunit